jgi:hypothetical protein
MSNRSPLVWRRSSYSNGGGNCVELAYVPGDRIGVRDSKNPAAGPILVPRSGLITLLRAVKTD